MHKSYCAQNADANPCSAWSLSLLDPANNQTYDRAEEAGWGMTAEGRPAQFRQLPDRHRRRGCHGVGQERTVVVPARGLRSLGPVPDGTLCSFKVSQGAWCGGSAGLAGLRMEACVVSLPLKRWATPNVFPPLLPLIDMLCRGVSSPALHTIGPQALRGRSGRMPPGPLCWKFHAKHFRLSFGEVVDDYPDVWSATSVGSPIASLLESATDGDYPLC